MDLSSPTGSIASYRSDIATFAQALTTQVNAVYQPAAGVSLDEEMTNLIRFQRGYQAAARAMSATDTLLDTLINRTGRVGL
jgi:flagellar hook-associated protein 1 FlgK